MTHIRQQIRAAAVTALTGLATTEDRVSSGDPYPVDEATMPALVIVAPDEQDNPDYGSMGRSEAVGRQMTLRAIGYANGAQTEDVLDAISAEVEAALEGNELGGLAKDIRFARMTKTISADGAKRAGEIRIDFLVDYRMERGRPEQAIA